MKRRLLLTLAFATGLFATASWQVAHAESNSQSKPNIIIIVADDLGYGDLGFQGGKEIPTPNLDRLAAGGVRLTDGYVTCPVCSPTRAGLATGRYQQRFGHEFNPGQAQTKSGDPTGLPLSESTLASALQQAGYNTAAVGKWHLGSADGYRPLQRGFDKFYGFLGGAHPYVPAGTELQVQATGQGRKRKQNNNNNANAPIFRGEEEVEHPEHLTQAFGEEAAAFIKEKKDKPFFLYLTFNAVHTPLQTDDEHFNRFSNITDPKRKAYAGLLSGLDDAVGTVLNALSDSGQENDTLVFFISDNGGPQPVNGSINTPLTGDKGTVKEGGIRVPFVVQWKGVLPAGGTYKQPVISLDVAATAAAAGGAKLGGEGREIDGVNLLPYLEGKVQTPPHESLYWRFGDQYAIRHGNYKLRKTVGEDPKLFDVVADAAESKDLTSAHPDIVAKLNKNYSEWNAELAEPLWGKANRQGRKRGGQQAKRQKQARTGNEASVQ